MIKYKKILVSFIFIVSMFIFSGNVSASGSINVSPASLTIEVGSSKTFNISAYNTIGDVSISSNNPSVASVSTSYWGTGMVGSGETKSGTITVTGKNVGSAVITLSIDAATFDEESLTGQTRTVTVNVVAKQNTNPTNNTGNNNTNTNNSSRSKAGNNNSYVSNNDKANSSNDKSTNNNIKSISVDNYKLTKVDNNNYTLSVRNDVTKINIKAEAEDNKSNVSGTGERALNIGDNDIQVIVASESGAKNIINIKVTRKDAFYLDDLDYLLENKNNDINIKINLDTVVTSSDITKIKNSNKTVNFNCYKDKKLIYSWIVNGSRINEIDNLLTTISYDSEYKKEIAKLSNYADGLYITIKQNDAIPTGTKLKLYVGEKFEDGDIVNIYLKDGKKLKLVQNGISVNDGYIEFEIRKGTNYFITMSNILDVNEVVPTGQTKSWILSLIIVGIIILSIITVTLFLMTRKNNKKKLLTQNIGISDAENENVEILDIEEHFNNEHQVTKNNVDDDISVASDQINQNVNYFNNEETLSDNNQQQINNYKE